MSDSNIEEDDSLLDEDVSEYTIGAKNLNYSKVETESIESDVTFVNDMLMNFSSSDFEDMLDNENGCKFLLDSCSTFSIHTLRKLFSEINKLNLRSELTDCSSFLNLRQTVCKLINEDKDSVTNL